MEGDSRPVSIYYQAQLFTNNIILLKIGITATPDREKRKISDKFNSFMYKYNLQKQQMCYECIDTGYNEKAVHGLLYSLSESKPEVQDLVDSLLDKSGSLWSIIKDTEFFNEFQKQWRIIETINDEEEEYNLTTDDYGETYSEFLSTDISDYHSCLEESYDNYPTNDEDYEYNHDYNRDTYRDDYSNEYS